MYSTRIKQWKINKNYRAQDKEALASRIAQAHREKRPVDHITYHNRPVKVDRILRHFNTQRRKQRNAPVSSHLEEQISDPSSASSEDPSGELDSIWSGEASTANTSLATTPRRLRRGNKKAGQRTPVPASPTPVKSLEPPIDGAHVELILHHTKIFYDVMTSIHIDHRMGFTNFWTDVKSAIYYLKKNNETLAWPLLNSACRTPIVQLISVPITFLREIFSTLSPVNIKMHAPVRVILLRYLRQMCHLRLGQSHPITLILTQLESDTGTRYTSQTCLQHLLSLLYGRRHTEEQAEAATPELNLPSPAPPTPNDIAAFQTKRQLTILLRRDHDLPESLTLGQNLISSAPTLEYRAQAMVEVVHILSDMCDYSAALRLCQQVLDLYKILQGERYPDSRASYAMEAMAELYHFRGDSKEEERWLGEALMGAEKSRDAGDSSTAFVRGKLEKVASQRRNIEEGICFNVAEMREESTA